MKFSLSNAKSACLKDAQTLQLRNSSKFCEDNCIQVLNAVNSWFAIMHDCGCCETTIELVKAGVSTAGLVPIVVAASNVLDVLLFAIEDGTPISSVADREDCRSYERIFVECARDIFVHDADSTTRVFHLTEVLLFLDRFTYSTESCPGITGIAGFRSSNRTCKNITLNWSSWPGPTILSWVKRELEGIWKGRWVIDPLDQKFSSGSCAGALNTLSKKITAFKRVKPCFYGDIWSLIPGGRNGGRRALSLDARYPSLIEVPKKLLKRRVIAPERVDVAFYAQAVLAAMRRVLKRNGSMSYINEQDQSVNRSLAILGSKNREWATIDMSAASDTISRGIFFACCPDRLRDLFAELMTAYVTTPDGNLMSLWMLFSSGHPLTWLTEASFFLAIGRAAVALCGIRDPQKWVYAYGDDLIVPRAAYQTAVELLESLGFTVNTRKSYYMGAFRESCGAWCYNGTDLPLLLWPRSEVVGRPSLIETMADLQHRSYEFFPNLCDYASKALLALEPRMTRSCPGSVQYNDIWDGEVGWYDTERSHHIVVRTVYPEAKTTSDYEHYIYYQYLLCGPLYASSLDELLHVSTSRLMPDAHYGKGNKEVTLR